MNPHGEIKAQVFYSVYPNSELMTKQALSVESENGWKIAKTIVLGKIRISEKFDVLLCKILE